MNYLYLLLAGALVAAQSNRRVIIKLKPTAAASHVSSFVNSHVEQQATSNLDSVVPPDTVHMQFNSSSFTGLAGTFSDDFLSKLNATHADTIEYVEEDHPVKAYLDQPKAPWGLARLSGLKKAVYSFPQSAGKGVDVYVIDSGLEASHPDFEGRAKFVANFVKGEDSRDLLGHGTHVAGTIAGRVFGVAKKANVYGLKVLDKAGAGFDSQIIAAITHVVNSKKPGIKTVINMSLGGHKSRALDDAITTAVNHGIVVVVAAGNEHTDACTLSPSGAKDAVAVGAVNQQDHIAHFSNYGPCVLLYAPGVGIASTSNDKSKGIKYMSGTSMASPHVAGVAALMMADKEYKSAREVVRDLKKNAMVFARDSSHPLLMASIRSLDSQRTSQAEEPAPEQPAPSEPRQQPRRRVRVPPPAPAQEAPQPREDVPQPRRRVPTPSRKAPVERAPVETAPVQPAPVESVPAPSLTTNPVQPAPVNKSPVQPDPVENAPVQPAPADDAAPQEPPKDSVDATPLLDDVPPVIPSDKPLIIPDPDGRGSGWMMTRPPKPSNDYGSNKKPCKKSTPGGDSPSPDAPGNTPEPVGNTPEPVDGTIAPPATDKAPVDSTVPPTADKTPGDKTVVPPATDSVPPAADKTPSPGDKTVAPPATDSVPVPPVADKTPLPGDKTAVPPATDSVPLPPATNKAPGDKIVPPAADKTPSPGDKTVAPPATDSVPVPPATDKAPGDKTVVPPTTDSTVPPATDKTPSPGDKATVPPADKPSEPTLDSKCTDGAFRCRGKGFVKCDHSQWVKFSCAPGTECQQTSADVILCNYPAPKKDCNTSPKPSRDNSPSNDNAPVGNDDATMQLPGFEVPSNKTTNTTAPAPSNTTVAAPAPNNATVTAPVDATGPPAPADIPPPVASTPPAPAAAPAPASSTPPAGSAPIAVPSVNEVSATQPVENASPIVSEPVPETPKMVEAIPKKNPWDTDSETIAPIPL